MKNKPPNLLVILRKITAKIKVIAKKNSKISKIMLIFYVNNN